MRLHHVITGISVIPYDCRSTRPEPLHRLQDPGRGGRRRAVEDPDEVGKSPRPRRQGRVVEHRVSIADDRHAGDVLLAKVWTFSAFEIPGQHHRAAGEAASWTAAVWPLVG